MSTRRKYTEAELDAMPLAQLRSLIHQTEIELARIQERQKMMLEQAVADPEWQDVARLSAWLEAEPLRKKMPEPKVWPKGYDAEAFTKGFVAKEFARMGTRPAEEAAVSATAKAFLERLG